MSVGDQQRERDAEHAAFWREVGGEPDAAPATWASPKTAAVWAISDDEFRRMDPRTLTVDGVPIEMLMDRRPRTPRPAPTPPPARPYACPPLAPTPGPGRRVLG